MLVNKFILGGVILVVLTLSGFLVSANLKNSKLSTENNDYVIEITDLKLQKTEEIKRVRDSATTKIKELIYNSELKFDSIIYLNSKLKYKRYEKLIYVNRSLDDALHVLSTYKYNERTKSNN